MWSWRWLVVAGTEGAAVVEYNVFQAPEDGEDPVMDLGQQGRTHNLHG